ncbi:hypothetical protein ACPOL_0987 [Acidisarcina polymorpha]|uniref:Uncharacterized protein n=1 Tax=Acidisarcina polymorpha TaxID=2211140 RepID=A0A2Z5FU20_9BACT|nr:hypothetical protein [Acidisarcina polymorpha]AXC10338.1 hypothetical protein ACPOL_0987 [Acidisarcina polymorpha]
MSFADAEKIAAAVLYEGYMLYPYRATSTKNVQRWNFGTLYPREYAESQRPVESYRLRTECLIRSDGNAAVDVRIRFLQLFRQQKKSASQWDEGIERSYELKDLRLNDLVDQPLHHRFHFEAPSPASMDEACAASLARHISGQVIVKAEAVQARIHKLSLEVANVTHLEDSPERSRDEAMLQAFISAHLLLGVTRGEFISLLDPPENVQEAVAGCRNDGVFPVLVGQEGQRSMMLCSPIILYDYPQIAPESEGDFFDGTEMDEMLALRVLTLTEEEKQEMRTVDDRARKILERTETLPEDFLSKVHGAIRGMRPSSEGRPGDFGLGEWDPLADRPAVKSVRIGGIEVRAGDRVRLWPRKNADILDMALKGKIALVEAIEQDFEDNIQLAVVLDDDPGREFGMMRQPGHRFFFAPMEVEPYATERPETA